MFLKSPVKQNRLAFRAANSLLSSLFKLQGGHRHSYLPLYIAEQSDDSIGRVLDLGLRGEDLHLFYKILPHQLYDFQYTADFLNQSTHAKNDKEI